MTHPAAYPFRYTIITIPPTSSFTPPLYRWHCELCHKEGAAYPDRARAEAFGERHVMGEKV